MYDIDIYNYKRQLYRYDIKWYLAWHYDTIIIYNLIYNISSRDQLSSLLLTRWFQYLMGVLTCQLSVLTLHITHTLQCTHCSALQAPAITSGLDSSWWDWLGVCRSHCSTAHAGTWNPAKHCCNLLVLNKFLKMNLL